MTDADDVKAIIGFVYNTSGYDFRNYSQASLHRRIEAFQIQQRFSGFGELKKALLVEEGLMHRFIESMTVQVTEMFRDPEFYRSIKNRIIDILKTYPRVKIWHAGCSNGAEVYSMAILLHECGLLERTRIYATDINETSLKQAFDGVYALKDMRGFTKNYQLAGGQGDFADYYRADSHSALIDRRLKKNVTFSFHNLATDWVFSEAHMIVCRNVLIYFNKELQDRVLDLFSKSLVRKGILALGGKESLRFSVADKRFEALDAANRIYRMKDESHE